MVYATLYGHACSGPERLRRYLASHPGIFLPIHIEHAAPVRPCIRESGRVVIYLRAIFLRAAMVYA